jgi:hypothetical protein
MYLPKGLNNRRGNMNNKIRMMVKRKCTMDNVKEIRQQSNSLCRRRGRN